MKLKAWMAKIMQIVVFINSGLGLTRKDNFLLPWKQIAVLLMISVGVVVIPIQLSQLNSLLSARKGLHGTVPKSRKQAGHLVLVCAYLRDLETFR